MSDIVLFTSYYLTLWETGSGSIGNISHNICKSHRVPSNSNCTALGFDSLCNKHQNVKLCMMSELLLVAHSRQNSVPCHNTTTHCHTNVIIPSLWAAAAAAAAAVAATAAASSTGMIVWLPYPLDDSSELSLVLPSFSPGSDCTEQICNTLYLSLNIRN